MDPVGGFATAAALLTLGTLIHYVKNQVAKGDIQRNSLVGIRTAATMSSDGAWKAGHAAAASFLTLSYLTAYIAAGITSALALAFVVADIENPAVLIVPLCGLGGSIGLLLAAAVKADSAARAAGPSGT